MVADDRSTPHYRYYVAWTLSGDLALELSLSGVTWSRQIRRAGSFSGVASFGNDDLKLAEAYAGTMPGKMSLYVTRDHVPVWGGIISRRSYDPANRSIQLEAVGFESYLYRRQIWVDTTYPLLLDQYEVVRRLIALMQSDFNGVVPPGAPATAHPDNASIQLTVDNRMSGSHQDTQVWLGDQLPTFGDAIEVMSDNLWGFEYNIEVDWNTVKNKFTKKLVFRDTPPSQYPLGIEYTGPRPGLEENFFEYPGNISTITYDDTIDDGAVRYWVAGEQPENPDTSETATELPRLVGQWTNEAYLSTQWPILESVESSDHSTVSQRSTLEAYGAVYGRRLKPPVAAWSVTVVGNMNPQVGSYGPGDWCSLVVTDPFLAQAIESTGVTTKIMTKRIAAFSVSVPDTEQQPEVVSLTLIDEWTEGTG